MSSEFTRVMKNISASLTLFLSSICIFIGIFIHLKGFSVCSNTERLLTYIRYSLSMQEYRFEFNTSGGNDQWIRGF